MKRLWAYAYQIVPPQPAGRLGAIRKILKEESMAARDGDRMWSARLVLDEYATHILIVSDDPTRDDAINGHVQAELERLEAAFSITDPMAVTDADPIRELTKPAGNGRLVAKAPHSP